MPEEVHECVLNAVLIQVLWVSQMQVLLQPPHFQLACLPGTKQTCQAPPQLQSRALWTLLAEICPCHPISFVVRYFATIQQKSTLQTAFGPSILILHCGARVPAVPAGHPAQDRDGCAAYLQSQHPASIHLGRGPASQ